MRNLRNIHIPLPPSANTRASGNLCAGRFLTENSKDLWTTATGATYQLAFMETTHMYNVFRMLYDMIALRYGWTPERKKNTGLQANTSLPDEAVARKNGYIR